MLAVVGGASDCVAGFTLAVEAVGAVAAAVAGAAMVVAVVVVPPLAAAGSGTEPEKLVSIENSVTTAVWRTLAAEATGSAACGGVMSPGATAKAELAQHLHDGCTATFSVVTGMGAAAPFVAAHMGVWPSDARAAFWRWARACLPRAAATFADPPTRVRSFAFRRAAMSPARATAREYGRQIVSQTVLRKRWRTHAHWEM